jgi:hypothetical protein
MRDFDKRFRRQQTFVTWFIRVVFLLIFAWFVAFGVLAYKAISTASETDWSGGLKPVLERVWCGKPGCLDKP